LILSGIDFSNGVIEFDVKGKNVVQQSFVGVAFHHQDEKTFDAVYFRPFNFSNPDTARRRRAVQYISMPLIHGRNSGRHIPGNMKTTLILFQTLMVGFMQRLLLITNGFQCL
jgi:hypothetical protein